jgi:glutathione S-transferase
VAVNKAVSRSARSTVLEHLRTLRGSIARARDLLMHFKDDRTDRDTLEPAARRIDELMNMFASSVTDPAQVALWFAEIQGALDKVPNPKAADALQEARHEIAAILAVIDTDEKTSRADPDSSSSLRLFA